MFAAAIAAGDIIKYQSFVYGSFVWGIHVRYNNIKYLPMDTKKEKQTKKQQQKTESEDELARVSPSEQDGLKHILVAVYAVPALIRYAWKQCCFKGCFL